MANSRQKGVLALFEHVSKPIEPQLSLRGRSGASLVPNEEECAEIRSKLNLEGIGVFPRGTPCSFFKWENLTEATKLAAIFMAEKNFDDLVRCCVALRPVVNEEIYVFAMMYAYLNRPDTRRLRVPPVEEVLPYMYFPTTVVTAADRLVKLAKNDKDRVVVPYEFSHNELDPEFRMAYFREDISVNSHHWHWHLAYPNTWLPGTGAGTKDRKGELFYYMHQQIIARYDCDRMANTLTRVRALSDFRQGLDLGYFPNLASTISGRRYASRPANMNVVDADVISLDRLELWKTRILEAVHSNAVLDVNRKRVPLVEPTGIDILSAILEAAAVSINRPYYGNYHNTGHLLIAAVHDPDRRYKSGEGVMGYTATAMRDPIFYRWHKAIDDIFDEYKNTQPPYSKLQLGWTDVKVTGVSVLGDRTKKLNFLQTYWRKREVLLSRGVDFFRDNPVAVSFNHLDHEEFLYEIEVDNVSGKDCQACVRLFLAPVSNELNRPLPFDEQRRLFIELEKFTTLVKPGKHKLTRRSEDSNVTIPPALGFEQLGQEPGQAPPTQLQSFCGCGWPHHLLIPKGRVEGMRFVLFAMVTNWEEDKVTELTGKLCGDAASYCGIRDQKYPDKRNMGFPFDRPFPDQATLKTFLLPNMSTREITIRHTGEIVDINGVFQPAPIF